MPTPSVSNTRLAIRLFGPFEILREGEPLPRVRQRNGHWLLALLLLRGGREVERAWLAGVLWPDLPEPRALAALRSSLSDLRLALGPDARRLLSPSPRTLVLDLTGVDVDLLAFDAAVASGDRDAPDVAVSLYRGPLLEECAEAWVIQERQVREQLYLAALETLATRSAAVGDRGAAEGHLRRAIATDPLRETPARALMQLLATSGNYAGALQIYRDLRLRLHRNLNADPDPETRALYERLRAEARAKAARPTTNDERPTTNDQRRTRDAETRRRGDAETRGPIGPIRPSPEPRAESLPVPPNAFIGRDTERAAIGELLRRPATRLVTLTGPGGIGKTRLALQVASEVRDAFPDGAVFVDLAPVSDPGMVVMTIATALGVRESERFPLLEAVKGALIGRRLLLLLDNFEHLLDAGPRVSELLSDTPGCRALFTSRAVLSLQGEQVFPVPPLSLSDEAVELFRQRAASVNPAFALTDESASIVAEICAQLEGLPLAIELAAARTRLFPLPMLRSRLQSRLDLLVGGARDLPARQRTLRNALAWSYDLLGPSEQRLFRRLSLFVGGCALDAIAAVWENGVEPLAELDVLVSHSLLRQQEADGEPRFRMLETIREFAAERLGPEERAALAPLHARHYLALAEGTGIHSPPAERRRWLDRLDREYGNLLAVLARAEQSREVEIGLRLGGALRRFWATRGRTSEGRPWLERLLALSEASPAARAIGLLGLAWCQPDLRLQRPLLEECLALFQATGDRLREAEVYIVLGNHAAGRAAFAEAQGLYERCHTLALEAGGKGLAYSALHNLGNVADAQGDPERARRYREACEQGWRELGDETTGLGYAAREAMTRGEYDRAVTLFEERLILARRMGDRLAEQAMLSCLAEAEIGRGDCDAARRRLEERMAMLRDGGASIGLAETIEKFADLAVALGRPDRAARLLGAAATMRDAYGFASGDSRQVRRVRDLLAARDFDAAWATGRAMSAEQAVRSALEIRSDDLPPSRSQGDPHSLPVPVTPLVGRDDEIAALRALLAREGVRLVTLTGAGGVGKTRLGLRVAALVADEFRDGAVFVELAPLRDPEHVPDAIASALGVRESGDRSLIERLTRFLRPRQLLLVLDNFEHLLAAAPAVGELLAAAPSLTIVATSRARLRLYGEHEFVVPPLSPASGVALFTRRATAARIDFERTEENAATIEAICRRLDGLPLAIELAAARVKYHSPEALLSRLEHRLPLLTGGPRDLPTRQQTLRDTIAWSYDLLAPEEQRLFRRLSVFAGDFTTEAAGSVCDGAPGTLESLIDQSLVVCSADAVTPVSTRSPEPRIRLLETIREFARERLMESGEETPTHQRHAAFYLVAAEAAEPGFRGPEQLLWKLRLDDERDNLRAAVDWGVRHDGETAARLVAALWWYWNRCEPFREGRDAWRRAMMIPADDLSPAVRVRLLFGGMVFARDESERIRCQEEAVALARGLPEKRVLVEALCWCASAIRERDTGRAEALFEESVALSREIDFRWGLACALHNLGDTLLCRGETAQGEALVVEGLALARELGDRWRIYLGIITLAELALKRGDHTGVAALAREALPHSLAMDPQGGAIYALELQAAVARAEGDWLRIARLHGATSSMYAAVEADLDPAALPEWREPLAAARAHLDDAAFAAAVADGAAMTPEAAIAYALESAPNP